MNSLEQPEVARRVLDLLCDTPSRSGLAPSRESRRIHGAAHPWLSSETYRGIGIARRKVNRRERPELAVVFYVSRKLPRSALGAAMAPASIRIPGIPDAIPVDVQAIGEVRAASGNVSGGSGISRVQGETGTLTCLVRSRDDGDTYLMSAGHVLAWSSRTPAVEGDPILSPPHTSQGTPERDTIATFARAVRLDELGGNLGDAAIALVKTRLSPAIRGAERVTGVGSAPPRDAIVQLTGATSTQPVRGRVIDPHFRTTITFFEPDGTPRKFPFVDQVFCSAFTQGGDSGAAVFEPESGRLVGIHLGIATGGSLPGGLQSGSIFSPIRPLLDALRVDPIFDPGALQPPPLKPFPNPAPAPTPTQPSPTGGPWGNFDTALDILARTVWGEAEGEGERGMIAVAWVIKNRALHPTDWGRTIEEVCTWPSQFECWTRRRDRMMTLKWQTRAELTALKVARGVLLGEIADDPGDARWFHAVSLSPPPWTRKLRQAEIIGRHVFYKLP
jgi:N-acetylmuramoyl-L-alanine amidase